MADWIELAALREGAEMFRKEIEALLVEQYFVSDQDDAARNVADAWRALARRKKTIGEGYPFLLDNKQIAPDLTKPDSTYWFLLVLSAPEYLSGYSHGKGGAFRNLFELIAVQAVGAHLPNWDVFWCGATSTDMKASGGIVKYVSKILTTTVKDKTYFASAQDGGIDFMAVLTCADGRSARPALWGQCASGLDWPTKVQQPNFALWSDAIRVLPRAVRAFAIPFALSKKSFTGTAIASEGWVLDRERIASVAQIPAIAKVREQIGTWTAAQAAKLPTAKAA